MKKTWVVLVDLLFVALVVGGYIVFLPQAGQTGVIESNNPKLNIIKPKIKQFHLEQSDYYSQNIAVYDLTDQRMIYQKQIDQSVYPASLTKIMTAIVVLDNISDLEQTTVISAKNYYDMSNLQAAMSGLPFNQPISIKNLLYGSMLPSGGDATMALADFVADKTGTDFVELMNQKANQLGLEQTSFANPVGFDDPKQKTIVNDLLKLIDYGLKNPTFKQIFTTRSIEITVGQKQVNLKNLISSKLEPTINGFKVLGGKSGTTAKAGLCWATLVEKEGKELLIITMGAKFTNWNKIPDYQKQDFLNIVEHLEYKEIDQ